MPALNFKGLSKLLFPFPPQTEQKEITSTIEGVSSNIGVLQSELSKYQSLKKGLMQDLLTGKVRV
jgi:type I restriction enzyme S subunit